MKMGGLQQKYRLGVPDSVILQTVPSVQDTSIDREVSIYVQDSWTVGRATFNPGLRFEHFKGSVRDMTAPAGRFLPERVFTQADYVTLPVFTDVSPRFGVAYDLFGNGKTALKANFGKYAQSFSSNLADDYNPMGGGTDTRTWRDRNGDDIAQENELVPSSSIPNFGKPTNVTTPDPDSETTLSVTLQRLGADNVSCSRGCRDLSITTTAQTDRDFWVDNLATTHADYSIIPIADPRGNGETIPIYSIAPADSERLTTTGSTPPRTAGMAPHTGTDFPKNRKNLGCAADLSSSFAGIRYHP